MYYTSVFFQNLQQKIIQHPKVIKPPVSRLNHYSFFQMIHAYEKVIYFVKGRSQIKT